MDKDMGVIANITKILTDFALTKFPVEALEVKGPVKEGASYRWRIASTRFKEVVVVLKTKKPLFKGLQLQTLEIYGTTQDRKLKPDVEDLKAYLAKAELRPV
jgi:hypothetical protein